LYHFTYIRRPCCNDTALPGTLRQSAASLGTGVDAARLARVLAIDLQGGAHVVPVGSLSCTSVAASWGEDMHPALSEHARSELRYLLLSHLFPRPG
jgi:hypothetical protein